MQLLTEILRLENTAKKMKHSLFISTTLLCLIIAGKKAIAQEEYFVQVNPTACSYNILDSIPIIKWISVGTSTFDKINKRYVFIGLDNASGKYLCSIDATNGSTVAIPTMTDNFGGLKFDNSTGILYGIRWSTALANGGDFVAINPANLSYTVIRPINLTSIGSDVAFDDLNHRYILLAGDSIGVQCLFSIDVTNGNIISKPPLTGVSGIQFDNSSGNIYGLRWNNSQQAEYLASINATNGLITDINSIPLVASIAMGYATFDEINKRYSFMGMDNSNNKYLFTLDATNGQTIWNPLFPYFPPPGNLIETEYDNSTGNLYALHWGSIESSVTENIPGGLLNIFPNPFSSQAILQTSEQLHNATLTVDDCFGQTVAKINNINGQTIAFSRDNLASGLYFIRLTEENKTIAVDKLVITDQ